MLPPLARHKSIDEKMKLFKGAEGMDFQKTKQSLKDSAKLIPVSTTQQKQEQKAREAKEYRAKILQQANTSSDMSPAYNREKASLKRSRKGQKAGSSSKQEKSMEGKATSAQCAFNLANILMVRGV